MYHHPLTAVFPNGFPVPFVRRFHLPELYHRPPILSTGKSGVSPTLRLLFPPLDSVLHFSHVSAIANAVSDSAVIVLPRSFHLVPIAAGIRAVFSLSAQQFFATLYASFYCSFPSRASAISTASVHRSKSTAVTRARTSIGQFLFFDDDAEVDSQQRVHSSASRRADFAG